LTPPDQHRKTDPEDSDFHALRAVPRRFRKWVMWGTVIGTAVATILTAYQKTRQDVEQVKEKQEYTSVQYLDKVEGVLIEVDRVYQAVLTSRDDNARKTREINTSIEQLKRQIRELETDILEYNQRSGDMLFEIEKKLTAAKRR
jgi:hypothetical protein